MKFNNIYDEVFLSYFKIKDEDYFIEHNTIFTEYEIKKFEQISTTRNKPQQK